MLVLVVAGLVPAAARAHAIITPSASRPADLQQYTLYVPNERDVATVSVSMKVPAGINFFLVETAPGWKTRIHKSQGRVDLVSFTGGSIPVDSFGTFRFIVRNPVHSGLIEWKVLQSYVGGEVVRWIGPPSSDTPAARTSITESAVPQDVIDVVSGRTTSSTTNVPAGSSTTVAEDPDGSAGSSDDSQGLWHILTALAVGLSLVAVGLLLRGQRRGRRESQGVSS